MYIVSGFVVGSRIITCVPALVSLLDARACKVSRYDDLSLYLHTSNPQLMLLRQLCARLVTNNHFGLNYLMLLIYISTDLAWR